MGVPGFFAWLLKNYKRDNIIIDKINEIVHNLYLDANCLFHPQCFKILNFYGNKLTVEKLEAKMIQRIINYISFLIDYVKPTQKIFIAVDGIAPMAKMNQQRKRRYKTVIDNKIKTDINKKYNKDIITIWSNATITPGTKFMEKLHLKIIEFGKNFVLNNNIEFVYSSYHTVGEGEHKILQDIKKDNLDDVSVIYGLDADLIFLALASRKSNIYLLREDIFLKKYSFINEHVDIVKDVAEQLSYISINETILCINEQFNSYIGTQNKDFTNDFIVICYFLGNDFIPNIPSIEIKNEGIDFLIDMYINTYKTLHLGLTYTSNSEVLINNIFFEMYILNISKYEDFYFSVKLQGFLERLQNRRYLSDDPYEQELEDLENMRIFNRVDNVKLGHDKAELWKFRYYEHYYGAVIGQEECIEKICLNYMEGIKWNMEYYFNKCISFEWQYKYFNAPFSSDLYRFLRKTNFNIENVKFREVKITPFIQLLAVLPPTCHNLLPTSYGKLMSEMGPIIDLFPVNYEIDMLYKDSFHKCIPLIPVINIERIINAVKNIKLTQEESKRNNIMENIIFKV